MENNEESSSISNLNELIKQNRNEDFKSFVLNAKITDLINTEGQTLMHTATATNNITIIAFLFSSGFDINAQNALGQTALHVAVIHSNFQAAQLLLSLDADILISDHIDISPLHMCFLDGNQIPEYIIACFLERLKRSDLTAQQKVIHLENVGCSIYETLAINDAEVIGLMLDRTTSMTELESQALLKRALALNYPENLKALIKRGPLSDVRLKFFIQKVARNKHEPNMKFYFSQLINWDVINEHFLFEAMLAFEVEDEQGMQMYFDIDIDKYARKKFGYELLVSLFENDRVDCVEIFKKRNIDVNGCDRNGYRPLEVAVMYERMAAVIYLLANGADPNIKNEDGKTPLLMCDSEEYIELLLEAGADVQVVDNEGKTVIDEYASYPVLARLCILQARGLLKQELKNALIKKSRKRSVNNQLISLRQDIAWMQTRRISKTISLFDFLIDEVENVARYVKTSTEVNTILEIISERAMDEIYVSMLTKKLGKALNINKLRPEAAKFLCNVMNIDQLDHLVIEKIISYLTYRDLLIFDKIDDDVIFYA